LSRCGGDPGPDTGKRRLPTGARRLDGLSLGHDVGGEHADVLRRGPRPPAIAGYPDRRGGRTATALAPRATSRSVAGSVGHLSGGVPSLAQRKTAPIPSTRARTGCGIPSRLRVAVRTLPSVQGAG